MVMVIREGAIMLAMVKVDGEGDGESSVEMNRQHSTSSLPRLVRDGPRVTFRRSLNP